jgi:hypothetical protein
MTLLLFYILLTVAIALLVTYIISLFVKKCNIFYISPNGSEGFFGSLKKNKITDKNEFCVSNNSSFFNGVAGNVVNENSESTAVYLIKSSDSQSYIIADKKGSVDVKGDIRDLNNEVIAHCDPIGKRWFGLFSKILPGIVFLILAIISFLFDGFGLFNKSQTLIFIYLGVAYILLGIILAYFTFKTDVFVVDSNGQVTQEKLGYTVELRFSQKEPINQMTKASACLALYEEEAVAFENEIGVLPSVSAKDLAFPAMLIYVMFFGIFSSFFLNYQISPAVGSILSYSISMVMVYVVLWRLLHMIKTDLGNQNLTFIPLLQLINRNTGISGWNTFLILVSAIGVLFTLFINVGAGGYVLFPLFLVICFATIYNQVVLPAQSWKLKSAVADIVKQDNQTRRSRYQVLVPPSQLKLIKYEWDLANISTLDINEKIIIEAQFDIDHYEGSAIIRNKNPFFGSETDTSGQSIPKWSKVWNFDKSQNPPVPISINFDEFFKMINQVINVSPDQCQEVIINKIIDSCREVIVKYNLPYYEMFNLITNFCQFQINYKLDGESKKIGQDVQEYVRFPIESLFDQEGDCDCYAALAFKIFKSLNLGVDDVKYAIADVVGVGKHAFLLVKKDGTLPLAPNIETLNIPGLSGKYAFCEATTRGWNIGINSGFRLDDLKIVA